MELLLNGFLKYSAAPAPHVAADGRQILPDDRDFSGFVFKIQANMDPRHRDRIAFLRVCSGVFTRDMMVRHSRSGKTVRLSYPQKVFAQERETVEEAFPGDIVGLVGHAEFGIGDTLTEDPKLVYDEIPRFAPECFAYLRNPNTGKFKQFRQGLEQLLQEGVIQVFHLPHSVQKVPLLAAVGPLQFEVVQYRLQSEYGAESRIETAAWDRARWVDADADQLAALTLPTGVTVAEDTDRKPVILFPSDWTERYFKERNPTITLYETPVRQVPA